MSEGLQAVLFDLDGTLLGNDLDVFMPRYFERISAAVSHLMPPREFINHLLAATRVMLANDGRDTNEEVFAAAFYPVLGHPRDEMEPIFMDFYEHEFPALQEHTSCKPEARAAVQVAFELGYDVVIATNPLFPEIAIRQRLAWAGIDDFPYALVTSYENSRACKPNLLYFQNILDAIGRPPEAALVVGNEPWDLVAAGLGCPTYLVVDGNLVPSRPGTPEPTYRGTLGELPGLLRAARPSN
jgi:FMN phosphatase YigB (HAD superfamily)